MVLTSPGWRAPIRQSRAVAIYTVGLIAGGVTSALILWAGSGLFSPIPSPMRTGLVLAVAALGLARDTGVVRFPLPENRRLVPQSVFLKGPVVAAFQFGFEMGTGARTYVPAASPYLAAIALLLLSPPLVVALAVGLGFGLGRAVLPWTRLIVRDQEKYDADLGADTRRFVIICGIAAALSAGSIVLA